MLRPTRWFVCWLIIGLLGWSKLVHAATPEPEYLTVRNGLPQGFVNSIIQDHRGFIWMATRDGLCRYDGLRFHIYTHDPQQTQSLSFSSIYEIQEDRSGKLWIRTENNHIDCFDPVTERSNRISNSPAFKQALGRDQLIGIQPDQAGNVWVATYTNGFFRLNANGTVSHRQWATQNDSTYQVIHALLVDHRGYPWLATQDGLARYNPSSKKLDRYLEAQGLPQNEVYRLHERKNGQLMLGFPGQFALFDPGTGRVQKVVPLPNEPNLPLFAIDPQGIDYVNQNRYTDQGGLISLWPDRTAESPKLAHFSPLSLLVDRTNVLWIGLNGDGVIKYDLNKRPFQTWPYTSNFQTDWLSQQLNIPRDAIPVEIRQQSPAGIRYQFDRQKKLWISSRQTIPYVYDTQRQTFSAVQPNGIESRWLPDKVFRLTALAAGAEGELWGLLGPTSQVIVRHNPELGTFTTFPLPIPANHSYVITGMVVDGGRIYLATENHGLLRADLSQKRLIHWQNVASDPNSLPGNALLCLAQDPLQYKYLWIGTFGEGLCRLNKMTGQIQRFTVGQGLSNNVIYAIRPDNSGHLWLSTNRGLCRFDTRSYEVQNYMIDDGLPSEEFKQYFDVSLPDGRLIFGGIGGYTAFDPSRISQDPVKPIVVLTALRINNQPVTATTPDSPIEKDINETTEIVLTNQQNFLSIDFAALEFNQSHKNQYRYKLIGLDKDWVYSGNAATATYTNLPPNTYTFVVNASNTSGVWSPVSHSLKLVIEPPLWATWWAYLVYALLLAGALWLFFKIRIRRIQQKSQLELREQESLQLKQLDAVKTRFFANITHEFRTPLTLILTPLEQVLNDTTDSPYHNRLTLIYRNANRLLRLINELLDLAKLDAGNLTITPTPADLPEFIRRIVGAFTEEAQRKQIRLQLTDQFKQPFYWFDPDKVEKILSNLMSNALKFTEANGAITISIQVEPQDPTVANSAKTDLVRFIVHNTGPKIPDQKLPRIFDRFYQADPLESTNSGSGIGLALVKELVEMMQGTVSATSHPEQGTTFTVELPCRQARPELVVATPSNEPVATTAVGQTPANSEPTEEKAHRILLVEDNDELAEYIVSTLNVEWQVKRVSNGQIGVKTAIADGPDLIISDVLMPEMDGYELCQQLKGNPVTSHIPIILLTAKVSVDSRLEGLTAGADDYIAKPFQVAELNARVRNRLEQQSRIRQHFRTQLLRQGNLPTASQDPQDEFMNRLYAILEERLDDSTFGVEPLAAAIGMSRMHLNRKVKTMTGLTPNELIRIVRLKRAAELLVTGVSVSEVADRVGFDTPAYFSKVFKDQYHLTPSEYVDQNRHEIA
ncbi:hybrid sensor histidine kinase/response regulator transcription factor [Spirosoma foliorum]|uniref:histidine kinase n=1 Tax=Spirosoma foliorum TaxID=2710596 RepID=A0A7G5H1W3_9BACT|nr:ATP-binding protein [Spirosoma foliorum]QMW05105.1 response regulator [Spirosoma foliorum]